MPTLSAYRTQIVGINGNFFTSTVTAGTTNSLIDTAYLLSNTMSLGAYDDWYIFRPFTTLATDKMRLLSSYDPMTGTLVPDAIWVNPPTLGEVYELHGFVAPFAPNVLKQGMTYLINEALKRCFVTLETTLTPTALATRHQITTAAPWVDAEWKVRQVGVLSSGQDRTQINPYQSYPIRGYVTNEGRGTFYINHPGYSFNTTDTIYLWTVASGYSQCSQASFPSGTQSGLSADTDSSVCPIEWVAEATLVEAYRRVGNSIDHASAQRIQQDRAEAAANFTKLTRQNFQMPQLIFQPLVPMGPR